MIEGDLNWDRQNNDLGQEDSRVFASVPFLRIDSGAESNLTEVSTRVQNWAFELERDCHPFAVIEIGLSAAEPSNWFSRSTTKEINRWERVLRQVERAKTTVIAFSESSVQGAALDLMLVSSYRVMAPHASLQLAMTQGVAWPGMTLYRLVQELGLARTRQLVMGRGEMDAQKALSLGLVNEVTTTPLLSVRLALSRLKDIPPVELAIRRQLLSEAVSTPFEEARGAYLAACDRELKRLSESEASVPEFKIHAKNR